MAETAKRDIKMIESIMLWALAILLSPLYAAVIGKVKAFFGGRKGPPLLIHYHTLVKLFKKGSVYSTSTTFIFQLGPVVSLGAVLTVLLFTPIAGFAPVVSFEGDVMFIFYLLGLGRFFTIAAALDTASPFEGMGAAREAFFPIFCEATLFIILVLFVHLTGDLRLAAYLAGSQPGNLWQIAGAPMMFVVVAFFIILLAENSRVPVDDPATHLELTMIHEVMVLDHSGPDLGLIELGSFIKLFFYSTIVARLVCPLHAGHALMNIGIFGLALFFVYGTTGVIESVMARYRMDIVPRLLLVSFSLAFFAFVITQELLK